MTPLRTLSMYASSVIRLRPCMVYWRVHRAVKGLAFRLPAVRRLAVPRLSAAGPEHAAIALTSRWRCEDPDLAAGRMRFLRDALVLPEDRAARAAAVARMPLLWQFHYHYHDWCVALLQRDDPPPAAAVKRFLERWNGDHPLDAAGARAAAWHPYVLSIRIEAWIRLHAMLANDAGTPFADGANPADGEPPAFLPAGVERMTRVLLRNIERGTRANHLMRNIKALLLAGLFLRTPAGRRALRTGLRLLARELDEQLLDDGMHFERSPMYHASVLGDLADLREALSLPGLPQGCERAAGRAIATLDRAIARMTAFLEASLHPDGEIPFFNDSTASFTLATADVLRHARAVMDRCGIPGAPAPSPAAADGTAVTIDDPSRVSGLLIHRSERLYVAFDGGDVGPDYQPGHAHCDTLSFELSWDGRRAVSDTGVFHYRESPERAYARSTAAHSTVRIDNADQSEVWKSFRVGRRAHAIFLERRGEAGCEVFQAAHDGYERLQRGLVHERAMLIGASWVCVVDFLHGEGRHLVENILHLHPGWRAQRRGPRQFVVSGEGVQWTLDPLRETRHSMHDTEQYPAFGVRAPRKSLVLHGSVDFPWIGGYVLSFGEERVDAHVDVPTATVTVNGVAVAPRLKRYRKEG